MGETLAQLDLNREGIMETFAVAWSGAGKFDTIEYCKAVTFSPRDEGHHPCPPPSGYVPIHN